VAAGAPETVRDIQVLKVQQESVPDIFEAVGTVRSARSAPLSAQAMGNIMSVNAHEGDTVKTGQVLVTIEDTQARAAVIQAESAHSGAGHDLAAAQSELALAQSTFNRLQTLYEKKSLSRQEYDETRTRLESATARRDTATAAQAQSAAAVEQSRAMLGHTRVRAPFDGVITERKVDPGALAVPGMTLLTVESGNRYRLEAFVDERDLRFVRLGQSVAVTLDVLGSAPLAGKVAQIVPASDPASRSFMVKIDLPSNPLLRSGFFGRASFDRGALDRGAPDRARQAAFIPRASVIEHGQLQSVYIVGENNIAGLRYVTLGRTVKDRVEVLSGLSEGEMLVAAPAGRDLAGRHIETRQVEVRP
jgi:RND family efflux transporter MFP subunit